MPRLNSGKLKPKMLPDAQLIGQQGINLIEKITLDMGFSWNPTNLDVGIDGYIEIRDPQTGAARNCIIQVQSKATSGRFTAETDSEFDFLCDERDLDYWMHGNAPVILIQSRPRTDEAYWMSIKDYFSDLRRRESRKIVFDKARDRFDTSCRQSLVDLAIPASSGVYLAPVPKTEVLCSNLVPLQRFPDHLYIAETECRTPRDVWAYSPTGAAWLLKSKQIISFYDLREPPWTSICDRGSVEEHNTAEWAYSEDSDVRREFVWLLNKALGDMLHGQFIRFDKVNKYYYYAPTKDLEPRRISYRSNQQKTKRTVFQGYPDSRDKSRMGYYRHSAFEGRFIRCGSDWYLQINPTYRYTSDGRNTHRNAPILLSTIKRLERPSAVQGQVIMWARLLANSTASGLFPDDNLLAFGNIVAVKLDAGIEDSVWLKHEEDASRIKKSDDPDDDIEDTLDGQLTLIR